MLKALKILKIVVLVAITLLFLDFTGTVHAYLGWLAKIQFVPALLAHNLIIVLGIIFITLLLGRVYCSYLCPLGIFQDFVSKSKRKKNKFSYQKPRTIVRYVLLAIFALSMIFGGVITWLEPYSAFGRMAVHILSPIYLLANNVLAYFAERMNSYAFYSMEIWIKSLFSLVTAIITFAVVTVFAYKTGRGYCNIICPVGSFLGLFAKFSLFKPRINKEKCTNCGLCVKGCKAGCIENKNIDSTRCVTCLNCTKVCAKGAVKYSMPPKSPDKLSAEGEARRNVMAGATLLASAFVTRAVANEFDGGLAKLEKKQKPARTKPIIPAGAVGWKNFHDRCTGCHLCVSVCPNQVLSSQGTKPTMSFERGYCRPECTRCSEVCPTGAIRKITREEKSSTQIGIAKWNSELCVRNAKNDNCTLCSRKCPANAVQIVDGVVLIDEKRCIGCGACEHHCPVRPQSAIYVEGVEVHKLV